MASHNDHRTQQQSWVPKGGGGWKRNVSNSHQSEAKFHSKKQEDVIHRLQDMFIDVLDLDVIQSVAQNCEFNLHASIEALMTLSEDVDIRKSPVLGNTMTFFNTASSAKPQTKKLNIPELPLQAKTRNETKHAMFLAPGSLIHKSQAMTGRDRTLSPTQGAIKVTYKTPSNCEESDSDADVVVEEEKEYDVAGGFVNVGIVHGSFPRLEAPSSILPRSITHLSDGQRQGKSPPKSKKTAQLSPVSPAVIRPPNVPSKKLSSAHLAQQTQVKPPTVQERVQRLIQGGTRVMVLMRGAPGSGKSHLATQIVRLTMGDSCNTSSFVFSTDDYFVRTKQFVPSLLPDAHSWNQKRVRVAAERKWSPIFVDNTNTEVWEMKPYAEVAVRNGYVLELIEPSTPWRYQESQLARRNVHGVPYPQIQAMLARFERNLTGKLLLTKLKLKYAAGNTPSQPAANPLPPQVKPKAKKKNKKAQAVTVIPPEMKPKRKRKRKSKSATQPSQAPEQPAAPSQFSSVMNTLAVYLAKKALAEGRTLDPEIANSRVNNGLTVSDVLLQEKSGMPPLADSCDAVKKWTAQDSVSSQKSTVSTCAPVDVNAQTEDDSSSGEDSSDDDDEDHEEEEEEVWDSDIDNDEVEPECKDLNEWQDDDDNEWLYQSDDNAQGDEGLNGDDNPESVPIEVQCWEYILVMDDSKWVYQKHHPETQDTGVQEDPDATTEHAEDLLIDLSSGAADVTVSQNSLNAECRAGPETSNLLIDILGDAEDNLENGVQQLLPPMNVPLAAEIWTKQSDLEVAVPTYSFSLAEFDPWLSTVPVETGVEAIHWETPSSESSTAASAVKELTQESIVISTAAVPVTADDTAKTVELCPCELEISPVLVPLVAPPVSKDVSDKAVEVCPLGLKVSTSVVPSDQEKLMPENAEGHMLDTDLLPATNIPLAEGPENRLFLLEGAELKLVSSPDTHEPCAGASNKDKCHNAVSSEEASDSDGREQCVEASDLKSLASVQPAPSYDLLTWVMKCKEEGAGEAEEVWGQEDLLVNSKEVHTKPDDLCGPREQRSRQRVVEGKEEESGDAEVQKEVEPPEVQAWDTVPEPSGSWENKHTEQEEHKLSAGPQPQRSGFVAAESYQTEQSGSGKRLLSGRTPTLLTPDDFMQCSWESRLVSKLQSNGSSAVGAQCCDVTKSVAAIADTSTNTHYKDFSLLSQLNRHQDIPEPMEGIRIITGHNRSISEGISPLKLFDRPVPHTLTLDKSSMTNEEDITGAVLGSSQAVNEERNRDFMQLATIFPNAPEDGLKEIFDKCCGDLNWAIDLLLESKLEQFTPLAPPNDTEDSVFQELSFPVIDVSNQEASAPPVEDKVPPCIVQTTRQWRRESGRKVPLSEESQQLKQYLEESATFSGASYPEHTLRIRKLWHGEPLDMGEVTTKPVQSSPNNTLFVEESCLGAIGSSGTRTPTPHARDALDVHKSDVAVDVDMDSSSSGTEEEDTLPITLDPGFVSLLYQKFGDPFPPCSEGMERVVNLPLSLARQIYYYLMESQLLLQEQQYKQMEQMVQEDEELARQLQEQEEKQQGTPVIPNLQEIMDMEMALALCRSDQAQMQGKDDDLATKLKKQMLCELFPNLDRGVLLELFTAHENSFERTFEEVMASTGNAQEEHVQTVIAPEALVAHEHSLMEQARQEQCKVDQENKSGISKPLPIVVVRDPTDDNTLSLHQKALKVVEQYRADARHHKQLHDERFHMAKEALQKGCTGTASYYFQMATLHKQRMDKANAEAVTFLQSAHTIKQDKVTLDLHYYQVPEALQVLDVFLDEQIATLADQHTKKSVFIITGRGIHSSGGKSRIRPAVESRLKKRGLKWSIVNPGLLKVVVKSYFPMSHTVATNS